MSEVSQYLNWLARDAANSLVNVAVKYQMGDDNLDGSTNTTERQIAALEKYFAKGDVAYAAIWSSIHLVNPYAVRKLKINKSDVDSYRYLAIDVDAKTAHANKVCSTDDERAITLAKADGIENYLCSLGLPTPLRTMTGNGAGLLIPIDLPNTYANYSLMSQLAKFLATKFDDDNCEVDEGVLKDPSRLLGIIGTINRSKAEDAANGRLAKMRTVVGGYPPNVPMTADAFLAIAKTILGENAEAEFDEAFKVLTGVSVENDDHAHDHDDLFDVHAAPTKEEINAEMKGQCGKLLLRFKAYIETADIKAISGRGGHKATFQAACECFRFGLSYADAKTAMTWFNDNRCEPKWGDSELAHKLDDAKKLVFSKGEFGNRLSTQIVNGDDGDGDVLPTMLEEFSMTDLGNARHFVAVNGDRLRYIFAWKSWLLWNGKIWKRDDSDRVGKLAQRFVNSTMPKYVATIKSDERRTKYLGWAKQSQSKAKVDAIVSLASTQLACSHEILDANGNLFNLDNGTLELDTMKFRPHDRNDNLTKISAVKYDPTASAPVWDKFISRVFQDTNGKPRLEMIEYVKTAVGYSMTADVSAQCFFVLYGQANGGKSKFFEGVCHVMGDYSRVGMQSLMLRLGEHGQRNTDDEADMFGRRMVVVSEPGQNQKLDDAKVKRLTGNEDMTTMRKFESPTQFKATHKLWLDTNFEPKFKGNDEGMGRRIKLIPFLIQIPSHERDEHLGDKLKAEASGILNWMLQGLSAWRANGRKLIEPREVSEAVGACRSNNDPFGAFLSERIEPNDAEKAVVNDVYSAYRFWAEGNGEKEMLSAREFGMAMAGRGYISKPSNGKRFYVGCSLRGWGGASDEASQGDGEHGKLNSEEFKVWADSLLT